MAPPKIPGYDFDGIAEATSLFYGDPEQPGTPVSTTNPLPTRNAAIKTLPDGSSLMEMSTTMDKFTDGFNGSSLDLTKWDIVRQQDVGIAVANGAATFTLGMSASAELLLVAKFDVTLPANVVAMMTISQRLVENDIGFGFLEVDTEKRPIPHTTMPIREFRNSVRRSFRASVSSTAATLETMSTDAPAVKMVNDTLASATTGAQDHTVYARIEDVMAVAQNSDSMSAKSGTGNRISTQVPSPHKVYRPFIHIRNISAPAASVTTVVMSRFVVVDLQELEAQVTMGAGSSSQAQAIPVLLTNTIGVSGSVSEGNTSVPNGVLVSGIARGSAPAAAVEGRHYSMSVDLGRRLLVQQGGVPQTMVRGRAVLTTTAESILIASLTLHRRSLQSVTFANRDNISHTIDLKDSAGGVMDTVTVKAEETVQLSYPHGFHGSQAGAWSAQLREAATTGVEVSTNGYTTQA